MTDKKFRETIEKIKGGEIDFFFSMVDLSDMKINTMNRVQLLLVIAALNDEMIASTDNWEGG